MYKLGNIKNTGENDNQTWNVAKKTDSMSNQADDNIYNNFSNGIQSDKIYKSGNYSTTKYLIAPNDDIKALQHSLNALDFTDRFGKKLKEDGIWGPKTKWAWNTMQGKKQDSFSEKPDLYYTLEKNSTDIKNHNPSVYDNYKFEKVSNSGTNNLTEKFSSWGNKVKAKAGLAAKAYDQYKWMIGASLSSPLLGTAIKARISNSIKSVEDNKDIINAVGKAYNVRPNIMAGIIFKEQLTQSLPDNLAVWDTYNHPKRTHSVGLAAIYPGLARDAWAYVNENVYLPPTDAELEARLATDPDFNIQTLAAALRFIAGTIHDIPCEQLNSLTDDQWKWIIYNYNPANSYNEKVMEYMPYINELLK